MRNFWMTTGVRGRSMESRGTFEILVRDILASNDLKE